MHKAKPLLGKVYWKIHSRIPNNAQKMGGLWVNIAFNAFYAYMLWMGIHTRKIQTKPVNVAFRVWDLPYIYIYMIRDLIINHHIICHKLEIAYIMIVLWCGFLILLVCVCWNRINFAQWIQKDSNRTIGLGWTYKMSADDNIRLQISRHLSWL